MGDPPLQDNHEYRSMICGHCGNVIQIPVYCGNRFCTICNKQRQRRVQYKLSEFVKRRQPRSGYSFKMLTLSIENRNDLKSQVVSLLSSFRRLRQRAFWRRYVDGGATVVEVKHAADGWHAHLHIVLEAKYIPWERLRVHWEAISGGTGCHIKRIPPSAIIRYVTKYVTKSELPLDRQLSASEALRGTRLFQPFGAWHKPMLDIKVPAAFCGTCERAHWVYLGTQSYGQVLDRRRNWQPFDRDGPPARPPRRDAGQGTLFAPTHLDPA